MASQRRKRAPITRIRLDRRANKALGVGAGVFALTLVGTSVLLPLNPAAILPDVAGPALTSPGEELPVTPVPPPSRGPDRPRDSGKPAVTPRRGTVQQTSSPSAPVVVTPAGAVTGPTPPGSPTSDPGEPSAALVPDPGEPSAALVPDPGEPSAALVPDPGPGSPSGDRDGAVSRLVDPVVTGATGTVDHVTNGGTSPVTAPVNTLADGATDTADGLLGF